VFGQACCVTTAAVFNRDFMIFDMPPLCIGWFRGIAKERTCNDYYRNWLLISAMSI
jgi:hypothetical protein